MEDNYISNDRQRAYTSEEKARKEEMEKLLSNKNLGPLDFNFKCYTISEILATITLIINMGVLFMGGPYVQTPIRDFSISLGLFIYACGVLVSSSIIFGSIPDLTKKTYLKIMTVPVGGLALDVFIVFILSKAMPVGLFYSRYLVLLLVYLIHCGFLYNVFMRVEITSAEFSLEEASTIRRRNKDGKKKNKR